MPSITTSGILQQAIFFRIGSKVKMLKQQTIYYRNRYTIFPNKEIKEGNYLHVVGNCLHIFQRWTFSLVSDGSRPL